MFLAYLTADRSPHLEHFGAGSFVFYSPIVCGLTYVGWDGAYSIDPSTTIDPVSPLENFAVGKVPPATIVDDDLTGWHVVSGSGGAEVLAFTGVWDAGVVELSYYDFPVSFTTALATPAAADYGGLAFVLEVFMDNTSIPAFWDHIGPAIKVIRVQRGIRQEDLAKALGEKIGEATTQSYISRIESGRERGGTGMSWKRLALFADILGCKASQVVAIAEDLAGDNDVADEFATVDKLITDRVGEDVSSEIHDAGAAEDLADLRHHLDPARNGKLLGK